MTASKGMKINFLIELINDNNLFGAVKRRRQRVLAVK